MKIGDVVQCVNNSYWESVLTVNRWYEILEISPSGNSIGVTLDTGCVRRVMKNRFKSAPKEDFERIKSGLEEAINYHKGDKSMGETKKIVKQDPMMLMNAIQKLSLGSVMGVTGTDWSWYYQLGVDGGEITVLTQDGKVAEFDYYEMTTKMWLVEAKSVTEKWSK